MRLLFPPRCIGCGGVVASDFGLCAECWRETGFISGLACDRCGTPLPGEDEGMPELCDDCLRVERPWLRGRAAVTYTGTGRRLALALKHGDRLDLVAPLGDWLARAARPILLPGMVVAPVPLHRLRLLRRRYNQSALLSRAAAKRLGLAHVPDLLQRRRITKSQQGLGHDARFANLDGAIRVLPARAGAIRDRPVLVVDDVMTSGATLHASAEACLAAGAASVSVLVLARVAERD